MQVIRIVPLAALPNTLPQVLDYFWANPLPEGSLVKVMIGRRQAQGLVLESLDLAQAKLAIKKSSFGLKKISEVITDKPQVTAGQLNLARWMARQYCIPLGLCLKTILPGWLGKRGHILELTPSAQRAKERKLAPKLILTQPDTALEELESALKIAAGPVLIVVPEVELAEYLAKELVTHKPILVHGELGIKEHAQAYKTVLTGQANVVIGTRLAIFLPFTRLTRLIMEDPLHEAFKSDMSPRYVAADAVRELANTFGAALTFLSPALSTVNHYLISKGVMTFKDHKPYWPRIVESDMVQERQRNLSLLSRAVQEAVLDAHDYKRSLLVFSPRRSYTSRVTCEQCHAAVDCNACAIPMRLNRHAGENMLICYHCAAFTSVPKQCPTCRAGRLKASGLAGSQRIAEAINECLDRYGHTKIDVPILDTDLVQTKADQVTVLAKYSASPIPVMVATQKIFSQRYKIAFDQVAIIEADALVYNPDFRTQERLIYQLEKLVDFKPQTLYLQSWDRSGALAYAAGRTWPDFYDQELTERKALTWPPFVRIAKMSFSNHNGAVSARQANICADRLRRAAEHLGFSSQVSILGPTPALVERAGGRWTQNLILKTKLPTEKFNVLLTHVGPEALIDIDPRSIT